MKSSLFTSSACSDILESASKHATETCNYGELVPFVTSQRADNPSIVTTPADWCSLGLVRMALRVFWLQALNKSLNSSHVLFLLIQSRTRLMDHV